MQPRIFVLGLPVDVDDHWDLGRLRNLDVVQGNLLISFQNFGDLLRSLKLPSN